MGDYRSKSYGDERMQIESYNNNRPTGFRSHSVSYSYAFSSSSSGYAPTQTQNHIQMDPNDFKLKKGKSSKSWRMTDPEFQRKRRVASYKAYSVEGKVKGSFRKSFRWLKDKYSQVLYGWW